VGIVVVALYWIRRKHPRVSGSSDQPELVAVDPPKYYTSLPEVVDRGARGSGHIV
jgi:hypothetical protein